MIWTFVGEHTARQKEVQSLLTVLHKKQPDAEILRIDNDSFDPAFLDEIISSQGLFSAKYIVVIENLDIKEGEKGEIIEEKLADLKESPHAFVMLFQKLLAGPKKKFQKYSFEYKEYSPSQGYGEVKGEAKRENSFEMADRLGERDVVGLWQLYVRKIAEKASPEETHGMFVWQVKGMLLAMKTKTAGEANMNDYPYTKAKRYSKNFSEKELEELLFELIKMYDRAHSGLCNLEIELERWVLGLAKK
jgi:hypothetical protein